MGKERIVKISEMDSFEDYPEDTVFELDEDGGKHQPERKQQKFVKPERQRSGLV
jgi:hypothetical protein|nr:MAG TPA: hypothetical protein [Caudoviricetes sp.]